MEQRRADVARLCAPGDGAPEESGDPLGFRSQDQIERLVSTLLDPSLPVIRRLSASVINKIAAGEVIERPASVVKELLENAVDAGATRIDLAMEQGGVALVRVTDNGCGMSAEQLPLAIAPHATSKICDADDLFRVATLGFRGEALASIAEVSRMVLRSRSSDSEAGAELEITGGQAREVVPTGAPPGTTIEVHDLFFNTPVRRKFLRSTQTELGHATEAFTRLALANPHIHFTFRHGGKLLHDMPPCEEWLTRVAGFFGAELADQLLWVASQDGPLRLSGYVARPSQSRGNPRMQYLFLNGRAIRDRSLGHALGEAYRGLLLTGRYPICFLHLEMPPEEVDVNVHPTKLEVRFQDGGRIYSQLLGTLRTKFLTVNLDSKLQPAASDGGPSAGMDSDRAASVRSELVAWAKGQLPGPDSAAPQTGDPTQDPAEGARALDDEPAFSYARPRELPLQLVTLPAPLPPLGPRAAPPAASAAHENRAFPVDSPRSVANAPHSNPPPAPSPSATPDAPQFRPSAYTPPPPRRVAMQVHNRYLIAETDEGLAVIDQHALHERVLYEQIRATVLAGDLETQRLLVPEPVDLAPAECAAALGAQQTLARLGLTLEPFGGSTVLVTSYPAMLANLRPDEVLRELVDKLLSGGQAPDRRDLLDELLHMIACKAAIKAGDPLAPEEIAALVAQRAQYQDTHHCPHGRPTALVFTREELDRQFLRT